MTTNQKKCGRVYTSKDGMYGSVLCISCRTSPHKEMGDSDDHTPRLYNKSVT